MCHGLPNRLQQSTWPKWFLKECILEESAPAFLSLRLFRYSAIAGRIVDANDIGLPDHEIAAYRLGSPPELVAHARTDDRGRYRLYGLEPGTYAVRTVAEQYEDGAYLPTFSRETERMGEGRTVDLLPEQQVNDIDVRPLPGRLFSLVVEARSFPPEAVIRLTLASDMGRTTVLSNVFQFTGLAPGTYDVYAETNAQPGSGDDVPAAYLRIVVARDMTVTLLAEPPFPAMVAGAPVGDSGEIRVRRKDVAGAGEAVGIPVVRGRAAIPAGRWEVMLQPPPGYYVSSLLATGVPPSSLGRADGWNEILGRGYVRFSLTSGSGGVHGIVKSSGDPVGGAPVYLEGWDPSARRRVGELRSTRTDMRGVYSFDGLAPGTYRLLSTFEYSTPDVETMGGAGVELVVDAQAAKAQDLDLYVIR